MFKIRILLVIIFIAAVITGYFITQPMIQAQDAPAYGTITGNVTIAESTASMVRGTT